MDSRPAHMPLLVPAGAALLLGVVSAPLLARVYVTWYLPVAIVLWLAVWVCLTVSVFVRQRSECAWRIWCVCGCVLVGIVRMTPHVATPALHGTYYGSVTGTIDAPLIWQESAFSFQEQPQVYASFPLRSVVLTHEDEAYSFRRIRVTIVANEPLPVARGDYIHFTGSWSRIAAATNPGAFDTAAHFAQEGIHFRAVANRGVLKWRTPSLSWGMRLRRTLDVTREKWARVFDVSPRYAQESAVLARMLLGIRQDMPSDITDALRRTGTFHIVAISGVHIGIIGGIFWCVMWVVGVPGRYRGIGVIIPLWLYALMVGLRPSVLRAMLMLTAIGVAPLVNRPKNVAYTLWTTACIYLFLFPHHLTSFGAQLTFLCVTALLLAAPIMTRFMDAISWLRLPEPYDLEHAWRRYPIHAIRYIFHVTAGTCAIWLITWPVVVHHTNILTPSTWLANILAVPAIALILAGGCLTLLTHFILPWIAFIPATATVFFLHLLLRYLTAISHIPGAYFSFQSLTPFAFMWYYAAVALTGYSLYYWLFRPQPQQHRLRMCVAVSVAAWAVWCVALTRPADGHDAFRIVTLDVGLGDAAVLHAPNGTTILVDAGIRRGDWCMGTRVVVPYLRAAGVRRLDAIVCSHFDLDHCGGIPAVLTHVPTRVLYAPPLLEVDALTDGVLAAADAAGTRYATLTAGDILAWGALTGYVINPPDVITQWPEDALARGDNIWSLVILWEWEGSRFLTTGDATIASEALQRHYSDELHAHALKVGHHGSNTSTDPRYIAAVAPAIALVSVGPNRMGLPTASVLATLSEAGVDIYRTDRHGAIDVRLYPGRAQVRSFVPVDE